MALDQAPSSSSARTKYTKEEYELAKSQSLLQYLQNQGYQFKREGTNLWRCKRFDNLVVNDAKNSWYFNGRASGGSGIVEYVKQEYIANGLNESEALVKAVHELAEVSTMEYPPQSNGTCTPKTDKTPKEPIVIPKASNNNVQAINYLKNKRGIDPGIINDCIQKGKLFQTKQYANVAFVSRDEKGEIRHITLRGTMNYKDPETGKEKSFRGDAKGSDKNYPFVLEAKNTIQDANNTNNTNNTNQKVFVFESAIDAMSYQTLCKINGKNKVLENSYFISMHGATTIEPLKTFLKDNPHIKTIVPCLDNDKTGISCARRIKEAFDNKGYIVDDHKPPKVGKDYNETLLTCEKYGIKRLKHITQISMQSMAEQNSPNM